MSDQRAWIKLWCRARHDTALCNLPLDDWARWIRVLMYVGTEGDNGKFILRKSECKVLCQWIEVEGWENLVSRLKDLPNISMFSMLLQNPLQEPLQEPNCDYIVKINNWYKYQLDSARERVKKYRKIHPLQNTSHVTDKKRREEKRSITSTSTSPATSTSRSASPPAPLGGGGSQAQTSGGENGTIRGKSIFRPDDDPGPAGNGQHGRKEFAPGEILARVRDLPKV